MEFHSRYVVPVQETVKSFAFERKQHGVGVWPMELLFRQALVVQYKSVVLPEQGFQFVACPISENIENASKWIML